MNQKRIQGMPVMLIIVMTVFVSGLFFADAHAAVKKKPAEAVRMSAVERTEDRIKALESALKITDDQKVLWNNVTLVMRENAKAMDDLTKDRSEISKTMNALEHLKFHSQLTDAQALQQKKFIPPFEALYSVMSDDQKKVTDTLFRTGKNGKTRIK